MGVRRVFVLGLFVILLGFTFAVPYQSAFAFSISVSPNSGFGHQEVTATLSGFSDDFGVNVLIKHPDGLPVLAGSCQPDNPNCSVSFNAPDFPEVYSVFTTSGLIENTTTEFTVLKPKASFSPRCGPVGTMVAVSVSDAAVGLGQSVFFDGSPIVGGQPDDSGNIEFTFPIPSTSEGKKSISVKNSIFLSGTSNFLVGECPSAATMCDAKGDVNVKKPDGTILPLNEGDTVFMGDTVETGSDGFACLLFEDGSLFHFPKDVSLLVDEFILASEPEEPDSLLWSLTKDVFFWYVSIVHNPEDRREFHTPLGSPGIRATEFILDSRNSPNFETIHLIDGTIDLPPINSVTTHEFTGPISIVYDNLVILDTFPLTQEQFDELKEQILPDQNTPPEITPPADVTVECNEFGGATGVVLGNPTVIDLEDNDLPPTNDAVEPFLLGDTTVTWTVEDTEGLSDSEEQTVTVEDTTDPDLTIPADMTVIATDGQWVGDLGVATASDICDDAVQISNNSALPLGLGENIITWTADDGFNQSNDDQTITVITAADATDNLIEKINADNNIPKNVKSSLLGPIKKVSKILNDDNPDNDPAACDKLTTFLDNLTAKAGKIDGGLAGELEADAQAIKDAIGCPII